MVGQVLDACEKEMSDPVTCNFSAICKCNFAVLYKYVLAAIDYLCSTGTNQYTAMQYPERKIAYGTTHVFIGTHLHRLEKAHSSWALS
jgi:hypothetical protein